MAGCPSIDDRVGSGRWRGGAARDRRRVPPRVRQARAPVRSRTVEAVEKFSEHTHAGLHLEKLTNLRDDGSAPSASTNSGAVSCSRPTPATSTCCCGCWPHDEASTGPGRDVLGQPGLRRAGGPRRRGARGADRPRPAPAEPDRLFASVGDADLRGSASTTRCSPLARTLADEAALDAVAPLMPENQADVLQALAAGYDVEQVWADVVAPRIPDEPSTPSDLAAAVERTQGRIALVDGPDELLALFDQAAGAVAGVPAPVPGGGRLPPLVLGQRAGDRRPGDRQDGRGAAPRQAPGRRAGTCRRSRCCSPRYTRGLAEALERDLDAAARPRAAPRGRGAQRRPVGARRRARPSTGTSTMAKDERAARRLSGRAEPARPFPPAFLWRSGARWCWPNDVRTEDGYLRRTAARPRARADQGAEAAGVGGARAVRRRACAPSGCGPSSPSPTRRRGWSPRAPRPPFRHVVVDEIQDLHPAQWRLLRAAVPVGPDDLFLTGDPHQRIYGNHVSLRSVGITRRRAVEPAADQLPDERGDPALVDGGARRHRRRRPRRRPRLARRVPLGAARRAPGARTGGEPGSGSRGAGARAASSGTRTGWPGATSRWSHAPGASRSGWRASCSTHGIRTAELSEADAPDDAVRIGTMHGMKGLEFRCVAVVGAGRDALPLPPAVTPVAEDPVRHALDIQQERCLLFVACTRARERLRVSWTGDRSALVPA